MKKLKIWAQGVIANWEWLLPTYTGPLGMAGFGKHYGTILLTILASYMVMAHNLEVLETVEKSPVLTLFLSLISIAIGYFLRILDLNIFGDFVFYRPKWDIIFYVLYVIILFLTVNEIWGL